MIEIADAYQRLPDYYYYYNSTFLSLYKPCIFLFQLLNKFRNFFVLINYHYEYYYWVVFWLGSSRHWKVFARVVIVLLNS